MNRPVSVALGTADTALWAGRSTELPDLTNERNTMPSPAVPRRVRAPLQFPRLDPADRPDQAAVAAERARAAARPGRRTPHPATTTTETSN